MKLFLLIFLVSMNSYAGFFSGPSKDDKKKIELSYSSGCKDPSYPIGVRIENKSKYTVNKLDFKIRGQIYGRSTIYEINPSAKSDKILKSGDIVEGCWGLDTFYEQPKEDFKLIFEIDSVEFKDGEDTETIY